MEETIGETGLRDLERRVVLAKVLDRKWREHLYEMDYLKDGIGLRGMGQRDPLVEYQREGYQMYNSMIEAIKEETVQLLFHIDIKQVATTDEAVDEVEETAESADTIMASGPDENGESVVEAARRGRSRGRGRGYGRQAGDRRIRSRLPAGRRVHAACCRTGSDQPRRRQGPGFQASEERRAGRAVGRRPHLPWHWQERPVPVRFPPRPILPRPEREVTHR